MNRLFQWLLSGRLVLGLLLLCGPTPLGAADGSVASLQPGWQWNVEIRPAAPASRKGDEPPPINAREEHATGEGVRKQTRVWGGGKTLTRYAIKGGIVFAHPETGEIMVDATGGELSGGPLSLTAFSELGWVEKRWLQGRRKIHAVECDVYVRPWPLEAPGPEGVGKRRSNQVAVAYIDRATRLPVVVETPLESRHYTFAASPTPLVLPEPYREALARQQEAIRKRQQRYQIPQ